MSLKNDMDDVMHRGEWLNSQQKRVNDMHKTDLLLIVTIALILLIIGMAITVHAESNDIDMVRIAVIESSGCKHKIGHYEHAVGCFQITKPALADWNYAHPAMQYSLDDMMTDEINYDVASWYINEKIPQYLRNYGVPDTINHRLIAYNWGTGNAVKWYRRGARHDELPGITKKYIYKYHKQQ